MFTGIVQAVGRIRSSSESRLVLETPENFVASEEGESVAVNGCCLTLVSCSDGLCFDLSEETLRRTSLGSMQKGELVNLERAATLSTLFGGHIVQGHVDCVGVLEAITPHEGSVVYRFRVPAEHDHFLIDKGSVTLDGISLTVVKPEAGVFDTWIIPHTLEHTNLHARSVGESVNVEFDVIAKHVEKMLISRGVLE